jgi:DNA replication and repair protein RecF
VHGGRALRSLGSQGQQRLGLLALLFGERDALAAHGSPPLMLLDDVMSELDAARRERLAELVRAEGQALITTTDAEHVPGADSDDVTLFHVAAGTATAVGDSVRPAA